MNLTLAICVYNAERYLRETLDSVLAQTRQDFKLLIVDDCSTDGSLSIIESFKKSTDIKCSIISLKENKGVANARQVALESADTEYLLFVDGDDLFSEDLVSKLYSRISEDANIMAVTCWSHFINEEGKRISGGTFLGVRDKDEFFQKASAGKLFFMPIHTIVRRNIALAAGGFETKGFKTTKPRFQDFCEELDLWTRMSDFYSQGKYFATVKEVLYSYRKGTGLSSNHFNMLLKMRYTKSNVRRRRAGKENQTFIDFMASLSEDEIKALRREAYAADKLRNGVMKIKSGRVVSGAWSCLQSVCAKPGYFIDKLKHNL